MEYKAEKIACIYIWVWYQERKDGGSEEDLSIEKYTDSVFVFLKEFGKI